MYPTVEGREGGGVKGGKKVSNRREVCGCQVLVLVLVLVLMLPLLMLLLLLAGAVDGDDDIGRTRGSPLVGGRDKGCVCV